MLKVLSPIWLTKPETARRVKQRIGTVLDWAKAAGFRTGENPVHGVSKGLPKQSDQKTHHAALPFTDTATFMRKLRNSDSCLAVKLAFEFLILTNTRTDETLSVRWCEIQGDVWKIPKERTKTKREYVVPLGQRCREILRLAKGLPGGQEYVFPGRSAGKPLSNMVFLMALRRMGLKFKVTGHGFRSTFRDWALECTSYSSEVMEMAMGHAIKNKTEAAYRRGDLLDKRRELMLDWERFATSEIKQRRKPRTKASRNNTVGKA